MYDDEEDEDDMYDDEDEEGDEEFREDDDLDELVVVLESYDEIEDELTVTDLEEIFILLSQHYSND